MVAKVTHSLVIPNPLVYVKVNAWWNFARRRGWAFTPPSETPPPRARSAARTPPKAKPMAARKLMVLAASLLECHCASALAMPFIGARLPPPALVTRSIGAQLASVDPAVWAAGAGVAATIRLQREALVRMRNDEIRSDEIRRRVAALHEIDDSTRLDPCTGRFGLNLKALAAVPEGLVGWLRSMDSQSIPEEFQLISFGVLARCAFELLGVVFRVILFQCWGLSSVVDGLKLWPRMNRIIALACASAITFAQSREDVTLLSFFVLGFLGSGRLFVV